MRLSAFEINAIRSLLLKADPQGRIYLFGSRADDAGRGGDIDVFFETSASMSLKERLLLQHRLSSECQTKVDLLIKAANDEEKSIYQVARKGLVL